MRALILIEAAGKAQAWTRITSEIGLDARILATSGHVCSFPARLHPIGIDLGPKTRIDPGRLPVPDKERRILDAVADLPHDAAIVLAMDNDPEGDTIAYDVTEIILRHYPERLDTIVRLRPGPITVTGIRTALLRAARLKTNARAHVRSSLPGRSRAVTDRWIGATFSRLAGISVGRVRSAVLGATFLNLRHPDLLRGRPETGEITLQARSAVGGIPFTARVRLNGTQDRGKVAALTSLANRFENRMIPGSIRPHVPLNAAIAPRIGQVRPFNTADALAYAARHHGLSVPKAFQGLQDAYLEGMISYPRTDGREMSQDSASRVVRLGAAAGIDHLEVSILATEGRISAPEIGIDGAHEALHPVFDLTARKAERLRDLVRRPIRIVHPDMVDRFEIRDIMATIVARRAFEAAREVVMERGAWRPDNASDAVSPEDAKLLRELEWFREIGKTFPWSRNLMTGVRTWPMDGVLLELMVQEGIGRPSTYAAHIETALGSGEIGPGAFPDPPRPTPTGLSALRRIPQSLWHPKVCRLIEAAMENRDNLVGEDEAADTNARVRSRVMFWLARVPDELRGPLLAAISEGSGSRDTGAPALAASVAAVAADETAHPGSFSPDLAEPSPFLA